MILTIPAWTYEPLTDEEVKVYWDSLTEQEKIEEIRKLDILEHSIPVIEGLEYIALLTKDGDLIIYPASVVNISIGYLSYDITFPDFLIKDFIEIKEPKKNYIGAIAFGIITTILGVAATGEDRWIPYILAIAGGGLLGFSYEYFYGG
jgi:hypothetical protein